MVLSKFGKVVVGFVCDYTFSVKAIFVFLPCCFVSGALLSFCECYF